MRVVGNARLTCENFNGVSDKLKKELIKPLKPGEVVRFNLLNGSFEVSLGREGFGSSRSIRTNDRILDPYAKDSDGKEVGAYVEIGVPETIKDGRVEKCRKFWVNSIAVGIPGNGQFELRSDSIEDMEVYEFLCLSNKSKDNPHRDKTKEPEYEVVDATAILAKEKEQTLKELKAKLARFSRENPEEAKELAKLLPKPEAVTT